MGALPSRFENGKDHADLLLRASDLVIYFAIRMRRCFWLTNGARQKRSKSRKKTHACVPLG